jgi:hypothetical protein
VDGQSSSNRGAVGNHVEVKAALSGWVLSQTLIDYCARGGIFVVVASLFGESGVDSLVNQGVQDLRFVVRRVILDKVVNVFDLISDHLLLITGTANTISVDRDLHRRSFILFNVGVEGFLYEILDD